MVIDQKRKTFRRGGFLQGRNEVKKGEVWGTGKRDDEEEKKTPKGTQSSPLLNAGSRMTLHLRARLGGAQENKVGGQKTKAVQKKRGERIRRNAWRLSWGKR